MIRLRNLLAITAFAAAALLAPLTPARAAGEYLCAPNAAGAASARQVTNPGASGGTYTLNVRGCAYFSTANSDNAFFRSQGYTQGPNLFSTVVVSGVLVTTGSVQVYSLPANTYLRDIIVQNTTTNAVTGGVDIGKTTGAADIVSALTCAASCLTYVADAAVLLRVFSTTAQQPIWVTGHTAGNSANLTITITYSYF